MYAAVGGGPRAASYAAGQVSGSAAARRRPAADYVRLADRPRSDVVVGAFNGAWGDTSSAGATRSR